MYYQDTHIPSQVFAPLMQCKKILKLNGNPAISYHIHHSYMKDTVFSDDNKLLVVMNGALNLRYGRSEYVVSKNQMAFVRNNTLIEYQTIGLQDNSQVEFILLTLTYELIKEFSRLAQLTLTAHADETEIIIEKLDNNLRKYMDSLSTYFDVTEVSNNLLKIKLLELLFTIAGSSERVLYSLLYLRKNFRPNITTVVEENLLNPVSINQLAVLAGRSLSSFRRDFLSIYNMPPSQWIRERRLKKAGEFLLTTNMTITDICYTLGFENITHFSRLFKSQFGHSPSAYRLQLISA
jgi:AraC-like DNA-binding protein